MSLVLLLALLNGAGFIFTGSILNFAVFVAGGILYLYEKDRDHARFR